MTSALDQVQDPVAWAKMTGKVFAPMKVHLLDLKAVDTFDDQMFLALRCLLWGLFETLLRRSSSRC